MKNKSEKIDLYLKQRFEQFEELPPEAAWKNISAKLGHNRRKGMVVLFFRIAAGMALLLSLGIGYHLLNKPTNRLNTNDLAVSRNAKPVNKVTMEPSEVSKEQPAYKTLKKTGKRRPPKTNPVRITEQYPQITRNELFKDYPQAIRPLDQGFLPAAIEGARLYKTLLPSLAVSTEETMDDVLAEAEIPAVQESHKQNQWSLGGEFAPLYSHRALSSHDLETDQISKLNDSESGILAYAGGLRVAFSKGRRLSVQTGIYYSRYGQEKNQIQTFSYNNSEVTAGQSTQATYMAITNSTGVIYSNDPRNASYSEAIAADQDTYKDQHAFAGLNGFNSTDLATGEQSNITVEQLFDYLEIPLTVKYKIIDRKFDFSLSGGLVTNLLVNNVVNMEQDGEKIRFGKTNEINPVNYIGSFGLGFEYPIASGFAFSLEPRVRYYLNPIDNSSSINVHPYSFGFFAGVTYNF